MCIGGGQLSNTLEKETQTMVMSEAMKKYGKPEIIKGVNTPQVIG